MPDQERIMLVYAQLAALSHQKNQLPSRDKFLLLAAAAACRAGWPHVAERCREIVLEHNAVHLIGHHASFVDAMRSPEFEPFLRQLDRFCSHEKAEHLLNELGIEVSVPNPESEEDAGSVALSLIEST